MSKDLVIDRRLLKVERVIGDAKEREAIESEIALPFKIEKVFDVIANVIDVETEVREGGVVVTGNIDKQLFVVDKGTCIAMCRKLFLSGICRCSWDPIRDERPVQVSTDCRNRLARQGNCSTNCYPEIFVKVTVTEQIEVVTDVRNDKIVVKKELLKVDSVVGEDTIAETITRTVTLPITAKKIFAFFLRV